MIVRGYVNSVLGDSSYGVRIPTLDKVEGSSLDNSSLRTAFVSSPLNCESSYLVNDAVYIEFENRDISKPVIIGSSSISNNSVSDYKFNSLNVNNKTLLSSDTSIGEISPDELYCLSGTDSNIKDQFKDLDTDFGVIDDSIIVIENNNNDNSDNYDDYLNKYNSSVESKDVIESNIGTESDESDDTVFGRLNTLAINIDDVTNKIGQVPKNKTVSSIIEDLKSKLQILINKSPKNYVNSYAESYNPTIGRYTDAGTGAYSSGGGYGGYSGGATTLSSLSALRSKFPAGAYWNHAPIEGNLSYNGVNNQDGVTYTPCPKHGNCGTATQTCNGFAPYGSELAWQCYGYAFKCGYDMTGVDPSSWRTETSSDYLQYVKAGDIIRYKGHSVYVTSTTSDSVTITDCNSDGCCGIRWDVVFSRSHFASNFEFVSVSP